MSFDLRSRRLFDLAEAADAFQRNDDRTSEARARFELGSLLFNLQKLETSATHLIRAAELFAKLEDASNEARSRFGLINALCLLERYEESLPHHRRVSELAQEVGLEELWLICEVSWRDALVALERWEDVPHHCSRIIAFLEEHKALEPIELPVKAEYHWAHALLMLRRYSEAIDHAQRVADWAAQTGERATEVQMRLGMGMALQRAERFEEARSEYERVLSLAIDLEIPSLDTRDVVTQVVTRLGSILERSPDTGAAYFERLSEHYRALSDNYLEGWCRYWRASCLERAKPPMYAKAVGDYQLAGRLFDGCEAEREAGDAYYRAAKALSYWTFDVTQLVEAHPGKKYTQAERAAIEAELTLRVAHYRQESLDLYNLASSHFESAGYCWGKGLAESGAAFMLSRDAVTDSADPRRLVLLRRAMRSFHRAKRPREAATAHLQVAEEYAFLNRVDRSVRTTVTALRSYERARPTLLLPEDRAESDLDFARGVRILISTMARVSDTRSSDPWWQAALWSMEQAIKGRSFLDQRIQNDVWNYLLKVDPPLREITRVVQDLSRRRDKLEEEISRLLFGRQAAKVPALARKRDEIVHDLEQATRARLRRLPEVVERRPATLNLVSVPPVTTTQLQACLNPGEAYLGFLWNSGNIVRLMVLHDGRCLIHMPSTSNLDFFQRWLRDSKECGPVKLSDLDDEERLVVDEAARELLDGVPDQVDTLIISPHGPLVGVPWHELPLSSLGFDDVVGEHYTVGIVPAAGVLTQIRKEGLTKREASYLGVACNGDGTIPLVDAEVRHIAESYFSGDLGARYLTTQDCRELFQAQSSVQLLHLACHASRGGFLLSQNGMWTAPVDLLDLGLRADLLLLTGCDAGKFVDDDENEFLGVVRQLMVVTRARAAVVSYQLVPHGAGVVFGDLLLSALTNRDTGRVWRPPGERLCVGRAVEWARQQMRGLSDEDVRPLVQDRSVALRPFHPSWCEPWYVVGDPTVTVDWEAL